VETTQTRALSIASTPDESDLLFVIKIFPNGRLGRWITEVLKEGMSVTFKGPFGNFVLQQLPPPGPIPPSSFAKASEDKARGRGRDLLFIATGAGIAPFRPMVTAAAVDATRRIDILFGVRSEEDLFWKEWLEETTQAHPNVFHHIVLSQPSAAWTGHKGRVQVLAPQIMVRGQNARVGGKTLYVCGNPDMTTDVKRLALTEWGIDKKDLHVEGYI
ncbi:hypothetical protein EXS70_04625, partial [Candidatus Peribacteria bacterium]|nr:hypothetical protein [Candidatus Peribacteria bacterium]